MVADIDWYLRAGRLLTECEQNVQRQLVRYDKAATKQMALMLIPGTLRNEHSLDNAVQERLAVGKDYDEAVKRVLLTRSMIANAPFHPPKKSWRAMVYWLYCCIKYRQL